MKKNDEVVKLMTASRQWHEWIIETSGMPRAFYERMPDVRKAIDEMADTVKSFLRAKTFLGSVFVCTIGGGVLEHAGNLYMQTGSMRGSVRFYIVDEGGRLVWSSDDNLTSVPACWFLVMRHWDDVEGRINSLDDSWKNEALSEVRSFIERLRSGGL